MVENKLRITANQLSSINNKIIGNNKIHETNYQTDEIKYKSSSNTTLSKKIINQKIMEQFENVLNLSHLTSYLETQTLLSYWGINKSVTELKSIFNDDTELIDKFNELLRILKDEKVCEEVK